MPVFGINPSPLAPISTEMPLVDVAKQAVTGPNGNTVLLNCGPHYPSGAYRLSWTGPGPVSLVGDTSLSFGTPPNVQVPVDATAGRAVMLRTSGAASSVQVVMPTATTDAWPWNPAFLAQWGGKVSVLRCMPWQKTMVSVEAEWIDRALVSDPTYTARGMPLELCLDAATRLKADPWLNVPARASDDYTRKMAELLDAEVTAGSPIYLEYSNETWNFDYSAGRWALAQSTADGMTDPAHPWVGAYRWAARRTAAVGAIARSVLGSRVSVVLGSQGSNPWVTQQMLAAIPRGAVDWVAIAPYVRVPNSAAATITTLDQLFAYLTTTALPAALAETRDHAAHAADAGVGLAVYEAGVSLVAGNNPALLALYQAASLDARMGDLHAAYLNGLVAAAVTGPICYLNSMGPWGGAGCWSLMRWYGDEPPKYQAVMAFAAGE